ncbi:MAG: hypothetical protein QOI17_919 [Gaiellales bacterium]|jgi:hypothetical protein|nr:hypothetical protein [Gaiellales bacterium]
MKRVVACGAIAAAILATTVVVMSAMQGTGDSGYRVTMVPSRHLSVAACISELRAKEAGFGRTACRAGAGKAWFRIDIRNVGDRLGNPACHAVAFDRSGDPLFEDVVPLGLVNFPAGPPVEKGTEFQFVWYLPTRDPHTYVEHRPWTPAAIDHYAVACHGRSSADVPI